jgi:hypothetical protein
MVMAGSRSELASLQQSTDPTELVEGRIWYRNEILDANRRSSRVWGRQRDAGACSGWRTMASTRGIKSDQ